jgi:hypothetical protein
VKALGKPEIGGKVITPGGLYDLSKGREFKPGQRFGRQGHGVHVGCLLAAAVPSLRLAVASLPRDMTSVFCRE